MEEYRLKLATLTFLDPACGSGNFLTETYLSLRRLENEALLANDKTELRSIRVFGSNGKLCVNSDAARVRIYTLQGRMIEETEKNAGVRYFELPEGCYIVSVETSGGNVRHKVML